MAVTGWATKEIDNRILALKQSKTSDNQISKHINSEFKIYTSKNMVLRRARTLLGLDRGEKKANKAHDLRRKGLLPPVVREMPIKLPLPQAGFGPPRWDLRASLPRPDPVPRFVADDGGVYGPSRNPCQWPVLDGNVVTPWVFCGAPRHGWPYCAAHRKRAYGRGQEAA